MGATPNTLILTFSCQVLIIIYFLNSSHGLKHPYQIKTFILMSSMLKTDLCHSVTQWKGGGVCQVNLTHFFVWWSAVTLFVEQDPVLTLHVRHIDKGILILMKKSLPFKKTRFSQILFFQCNTSPLQAAVPLYSKIRELSAFPLLSLWLWIWSLSSP